MLESTTQFQNINYSVGYEKKIPMQVFTFFLAVMIPCFAVAQLSLKPFIYHDYYIGGNCAETAPNFSRLLQRNDSTSCNPSQCTLRTILGASYYSRDRCTEDRYTVAPPINLPPFPNEYYVGVWENIDSCSGGFSNAHLVFYKNSSCFNSGQIQYVVLDNRRIQKREQCSSNCVGSCTTENILNLDNNFINCDSTNRVRVQLYKVNDASIMKHFWIPILLVLSSFLVM